MNGETAFWLPSFKLPMPKSILMLDMTYESASLVPKFELSADGKRWNLHKYFYQGTSKKIHESYFEANERYRLLEGETHTMHFTFRHTHPKNWFLP